MLYGYIDNTNEMITFHTEFENLKVLPFFTQIGNFPSSVTLEKPSFVGLSEGRIVVFTVQDTPGHMDVNYYHKETFDELTDENCTLPEVLELCKGGRCSTEIITGNIKTEKLVNYRPSVSKNTICQSFGNKTLQLVSFGRPARFDEATQKVVSPWGDTVVLSFDSSNETFTVDEFSDIQKFDDKSTLFHKEMFAVIVSHDVNKFSGDPFITIEFLNKFFRHTFPFTTTFIENKDIKTDQEIGTRIGGLTYEDTFFVIEKDGSLSPKGDKTAIVVSKQFDERQNKEIFHKDIFQIITIKSDDVNKDCVFCESWDTFFFFLSFKDETISKSSAIKKFIGLENDEDSNDYKVLAK